MKRFLLMTSMAMLLAAPAYAMKITNLDHVPHTVEVWVAGSSQTRVIQPNATEIFGGTTQGRLSLKTAPEIKRGGVVQTQGMLSRYIGNGRNQDVPFDPNDNYTIWPGGEIALQSRVKQGRGF